MSAVTLETLRADYEAHMDTLIFSFLAHGKWVGDIIHVVVAALEVAKRSPAVLRDTTALKKLSERLTIPDVIIREAAILEVAERNGLEAAMLFKLSGGNIGPRVSA